MPKMREENSVLFEGGNGLLQVIPTTMQARRRRGSKGSNEPPLEVNNGGLKTQTVDFQLLANTGGMENKLRALQVLNYPARRR